MYKTTKLVECVADSSRAQQRRTAAEPPHSREEESAAVSTEEESTAEAAAQELSCWAVNFLIHRWVIIYKKYKLKYFSLSFKYRNSSFHDDWSLHENLAFVICILFYIISRFHILSSVIISTGETVQSQIESVLELAWSKNTICCSWRV